MKKEYLTDLERIIQGFEIFKKYGDKYNNVAAEHDEIFAGPDPNIVSISDLEKLEEIGWHVNDVDCFSMYV